MIVVELNDYRSLEAVSSVESRNSWVLLTIDVSMATSVAMVLFIKVMHDHETVSSLGWKICKAAARLGD